MGLWRGIVLLLAFMIIGRGEGKLVENFYSSSCPNVESIVQQAVSTKFNQTFTTIPATLRLFFHDCFVQGQKSLALDTTIGMWQLLFAEKQWPLVDHWCQFLQGCDASIMISSPNNDAEKDAPDNLSLAGDGFDTVIKAKQAVEQACPGKVSCADIVAIAARDVVVLAGGPSFNVELGRRDGLISQASLVAGNLPEPTFNLNQLKTIFAKNNLSQNDMIALSGAHTVGFSHCSRFSNRLYSFSSSSPVDPSLNSAYAQQLEAGCPQNVDPSIAVDLDPVTPQTFDNVYYQNLVAGKGLLTSDQVLYTDPTSKPTIVDFANNPGDFNGTFIAAMRKLGRVGVKTGNDGQIRTDCTAFNS